MTGPRPSSSPRPIPMPRLDYSPPWRSGRGAGRSRIRRFEMGYWLFKSEPETWSWDMQVSKGKAGEEWTGVRNYQARNNMRAMRLGDQGFFYHSNEEKA